MLKLVADRNKQDALDSISRMPGVALVDCQAADADGMQNAAFLARLEGVLCRIEADAGCRLIVFQGLGLTRQDDALSLPNLHLYSKREQLLKRFRGLAPLSVALVDGACSGTHFEIALCADACLASDESSFAVPELAQGYLPGISMFRLAMQIGLRPARKLMLLNGSFGAHDALAQGLVDAVCPVAEFPQHLASIIARTATNGRVATQMSRRLLEESYSTPYEDSIGHFLAAQHRCYAKLTETDQ
ncbi:enoyl-CoA hydratase/isomerase family protein [Pandoraea sp. XY-2]|uniref:enoyl-CoA hydratase/isomerase family protein n=1 Tax=Pandoraea sp. XY-2 TaxID=2518599 RepID=UPI00101B195D|nr:enoyl-CoA hydratase/isomerase family protein [Pandoraea sp. XY-2]QBC31591.1 hypothetical protein DRB87_09765 [Pandoraea sp. XY-2]